MYNSKDLSKFIAFCSIIFAATYAETEKRNEHMQVQIYWKRVNNGLDSWYKLITQFKHASTTYHQVSSVSPNFSLEVTNFSLAVHTNKKLGTVVRPYGNGLLGGLHIIIMNSSSHKTVGS